MNIILDGMGGDFAPLETLLGAAQAVSELGVSITLTGDESAIASCAAQHSVSMDGITVVNAPQVIPMDADPTKILKQYSESSLATGLRLLSEGKGDAIVSAGSTGALLVGATFLVKRIKGVKRPAIGTMIPTGGGKSYLLIDAGANHDCRPEMLNQFAVMGTAYFQGVCGVANPRVGLINIGSEDHKGDDLRKASLVLLRENKGINFIGNIEARELPLGGCDVAVCDGFTGNIILKLSEGFGKYFKNTLKEMLSANVGTKLAAVFLKGQLSEFKKLLDYKEHGGAPLLGVKSPVIKAHGSSDAKAFKNAIKQAKFCCESDVAGKIALGVLGDSSEEQE